MQDLKSLITDTCRRMVNSSIEPTGAFLPLSPKESKAVRLPRPTRALVAFRNESLGEPQSPEESEYLMVRAQGPQAYKSLNPQYEEFPLLAAVAFLNNETAAGNVVVFGTLQVDGILHPIIVDPTSTESHRELVKFYKRRLKRTAPAEIGPDGGATSEKLRQSSAKNASAPTKAGRTRGRRPKTTS